MRVRNRERTPILIGLVSYRLNRGLRPRDDRILSVPNTAIQFLQLRKHGQAGQPRLWRRVDLLLCKQV